MRGSALIMNAANDDVTDITAADDDKDDCVIETQEELNARKFKPAYAYFVLFITLIARIMVQWQRKGINYSYGYTGLGPKMNNPIYEMGTFYPQLTEWYGWLIGFFYTIPYCFFGLVAGKMTDTVNRKTFLGIVLILAGAAVGVSGVYDSFLLLAIMRMVHGCLNSASNPVSFSLIQDYFPPEKRATANSLIQAGNYIGVGVSSLSILLINQFGWRYLYKFMGGLGVIFGIFTMLFVKEPERGGFLDEATKRKEARKKAEEAAQKAASGGVGGFFKSMNDVFKLPTCRNVLIAGSLRNFGGIIISSFLPLFFGRNYAAYKSQYSVLNAAGMIICGLTASLGGGIIADKYEKKSYWTKAALCMSGCALSVPIIALGTLQTSNFYLSMFCYALKVLVSGTYSGPAITMMQNTAPTSQQGSVVSVYFFSITMAQTIAPIIFGYFAKWAGVLANPTLYGPLITGFCALSYLGSLPFWFRAGKHYKKYMEDKDAENARLACAE